LLVLKRIMVRVRNMLTLLNSRDAILLRVVARQRLNAKARRKLTEAFQVCLGHQFKLDTRRSRRDLGRDGFRLQEIPFLKSSPEGQ
jgi:hypothetical protein